MYLDEATHKFILTLLNFLPTSAYYHQISSQRVHPSLTSQGSTVNRIRTTNLRKEAGPPTSTLESPRALGSPGVLLAKVTRQPTTKDDRRRTNYCCDLEEVILFPLYTVTLAFFWPSLLLPGPFLKKQTHLALTLTLFSLFGLLFAHHKAAAFFQRPFDSRRAAEGEQSTFLQKGKLYVCVEGERERLLRFFVAKFVAS